MLGRATLKTKGTRPLVLRIHETKSTRFIIRGLLDAAFERQEESAEMMVAGAVMEHLVGAKLTVALPGVDIKHKGFCVADAPQKGSGDFLVGDTAIHVTTAPTEALIRKCSENLAHNLRPLIITTVDGVKGGEALAKDAGIKDRIDILEIEQFVATNIYEWTGFVQEARKTRVAELFDVYNSIIDACETDPNLEIAIE